MCDGQIEGRIDAHTRRRARLDRRTNTARRVRIRGDDFCSGQSGHERHVYRDGRRTYISRVDAGKEAVVAVLDAGHFFGEGCLAGQTQRMATATALAPSTVLAVEKPEMVRQLHAQPAFADRFLTHMLTRNIRIEEDPIDQLFNSTEKRLVMAGC